MRLIYILLFFTSVTIISVKGNVPQKKPLHAEHSDDKWDSSDMDDDNDSGESKENASLLSTQGRRFLPLGPEQTTKLANMMPHLKTIWLELLTIIQGTNWQELGKTLTTIFNTLSRFVKKS